MNISKTAKPCLLFIIPLLLISFTIGDSKSEYSLQPAANSIYSDDIDLDGDIDLLVGHNFNAETGWTGITMLLNNVGFFIKDTLTLYGQHRTVITDLLNSNNYPDLITQFYENNSSKIAIVFDFNTTLSTLHSITINGYADNITTGNIDNVNGTDIVFANNIDQFWGILYNDGTGNFSEPAYHYVYGYYPTNIDCGDLNGDNREDIVICGQSTEVYFSYPANFQKLTLETNDFKNDISLSDFDKDGDLDIITFVELYIVNYTAIKIYENLGNNNFDTLQVFVFQPACFEFFISDLDNDSLPDIVFHTDDLTGAYIFYNQGSFTLSEPQFLDIPYYGEYTRMSHCDDLDGNGYNDIITLRSLYSPLSNNLSILFNDGNGNFQEDPIIGISALNFELQTSNLMCFPNPFKRTTQICYKLGNESTVQLNVYNYTGQLIKSINAGPKPKGNHFIDFDATGFKNGIYFYAISINGQVSDTKKMTLVK